MTISVFLFVKFKKKINNRLSSNFPVAFLDMELFKEITDKIKKKLR